MVKVSKKKLKIKRFWNPDIGTLYNHDSFFKEKLYQLYLLYIYVWIYVYTTTYYYYYINNTCVYITEKCVHTYCDK